MSFKRIFQKNMKKILLTFTTLVAISTANFGQQVPLYSNYMTNVWGFNPAYIGTTEYIELRAIHRTQWVNVEGKPQSTLVGVNGKVGRLPIHVGGTFYSDEMGRISKSGFLGLVSVSQKITERMNFHLGVSAGTNKYKLSEDAFEREISDAVLDGARLGTWLPELNLGVYLKQQNGIFLGFSVPQILQKKVFFDKNLQQTNPTAIARQYFTMAGYTIKLNENLQLEPTAQVKFSPKTSPQYDFSVRGILKKTYWLGGSFRTEDAATAMMGVDFKKWYASYGYDMTVSSLRNSSAGSHEVSVGLRFGKPKCPDADKDGICDKEDKCPGESGTKERQGCPEPKKEMCADRDKDGICDTDDLCPDVIGTKELKGCPTNDKDNDGLRDDIDKCPDVPGSLKNEGCPNADRDKDGILDEIDPCPDVHGPLSNRGCPEESDRDKDGIPDKLDVCPDLAGFKERQGCPTNDRDNDGIPDELDKCPSTAGATDNQGCPVVQESDKLTVSLAIQNLYFDTDKWNIRPVALRNLNALAKLLREKKDWKIRVSGHADIRGNKQHNEFLSKNRAEVVKNYLISKGVSPNLILLEHMGDSTPAANANTSAGLQLNRRTEIEFYFD
jgi:type IX secretion system PorP/SprF family membrane protein